MPTDVIIATVADRVSIDLRKNTGICIVANAQKKDTPEWIGKIAEAAKGK